MTTGSTAQVLKRHMDSVIKVGGGQKCGSSGRRVLGGFWVLRQVMGIRWWESAESAARWTHLKAGYSPSN